MDKSIQSQEELFYQVLSLPAEARDRLMSQARATDPELCRAVEALLEAHNSAGDFLSRSHLPVSSSRAQFNVTLYEESPGTLIDRYRLVEKLGEGGCGSVYAAEQQVPVPRTVAIKVIKLGMDTKSVVDRFAAERQALAMMEHPNIATIYDGGTTERGRPYFVMELVRGSPITTYCDEQRLSIDARIKMFISVCHAIQHAHQKGLFIAI